MTIFDWLGSEAGRKDNWTALFLVCAAFGATTILAYSIEWIKTSIERRVIDRYEAEKEGGE